MRHSTRTLAFFALLVCLTSITLLAQPTARTGARMEFDEEIGSVVLFGGFTPPDSSRSRYPLADMWEWSGRRWRQLTPETSPGARGDFVMVYDSVRSRLLIFGGVTAPIVPNRPVQVANDTWVFDNGQWTQLATPTAPPARRLPGAAYDAARDRVVLFGGFTADGTLFDTWEFDGVDWQLANESGPKVTSPMLVYNAIANETLMLGLGEGGKGEMHRWTGAAWEKLNPETVPECITQGSLIYHRQAARPVYYGGLCSSGFATDDMWQWDGTTWTEFEPFPTAGGVFAAAAAYDAERHEIVLFGGDSFGARNSTFRFANNQWIAVSNGFTPGPRSMMVFESDPVNGVIWMFGGQNESGRFDDLWSYSFGRWDRVNVFKDAPTSCAYPVGAFDTDRARLVVVCEDASTFEWDGLKWTKFSDLKTRPPVRRFSSMVYDPRTRKTVLFGGYDGIAYLKETWLWNGTEWTKAKKDGSPPSRGLAALFFDPNQQRVMLYGGIGRPTTEDAIVRYSDMWSFDGTSWTEMKSVTTPPARYGAFVEINPLSSRVVLFGGKDERERYLNEHWEWNGTAWTQVDTQSRPSPRMNGMAAWDPSRQQVTIFGGYSGAYFSEVWALEGQQWVLQQEVETPRRRAAGR